MLQWSLVYISMFRAAQASGNITLCTRIESSSHLVSLASGFIISVTNALSLSDSRMHGYGGAVVM